MTISERSRHDLYERLVEVLGPDDAATLMEHLPPVGWADVATKRDLDHLAEQVRSEMQAGFADLRVELHRELAVLRSDAGRQLQMLFLGLVGLQVSSAGLALALSKLL